MTSPNPSSEGVEASSRRSRIAVISEPGKAGVKAHVVELLQNIDLTRFEIVYYYSLQRSDASYPQEVAALQARGITCVELPMDTGVSPIKNLRAFLTLVSAFRARPPAVMHLHSSIAGGLGRLASMVISPPPVILYTPHAMAAYRSRVYLWLERFLARFTDTLIAVSTSEKQDFIRWGIVRAEKAEIIPLGLVQTERATPPVSPPETPARWTLGACGRICYQKNSLLFFQVALELLRSGKDYHFKWIGDFGDDAEARAVRVMLDRAGNPPQIEITGWVPNPQAYLETLDVFCMFSRYESFGYVTAEAMQLGVPVLATEATGTIDLVRQEVTGLFAERDVAAVIASLQRLQSDPALRARLTANARQFVAENHTIPQMVAATERLYLQHLPK